LYAMHITGKMMTMAIGKRNSKRQETLWIPTGQIPEAPAHPFYQRLNSILAMHKFDDFVEGICAKFYAPTMGRPSLAPGIYFRMLLIGYVEGLDSERGIAWRTADSLALRDFLGLALTYAAPDHSTVSRTCRLIDVETHQAVFTWVLRRIAETGLLKRKSIGIDATTLEANAALKSIVRRDTGDSYQEFLVKLSKESGIETPTKEELARFDRKRSKKGSNDEWIHPHDPDSQIAKMKNGSTHLAHKTENAVDLETGVVVGVTVQPADSGDTTTMIETLITAAEQIEEVSPKSQGIQDAVADKGYHSTERVTDLQKLGIRSVISEPKRPRRCWKEIKESQAAAYANRRRIRSRHGKALLRLRAERVERPFAHLYETGRMRRTHLRGRNNILKRILIHVSALNLGSLMRAACGIGTPRSPQGCCMALFSVLFNKTNAVWARIIAIFSFFELPDQPLRDFDSGIYYDTLLSVS
jgi:transposase